MMCDRGSLSSLSPPHTPTSLAHLLNTRAKVGWTLACFLLRFLVIECFTRGQDGTHFCLSWLIWERLKFDLQKSISDYNKENSFPLYLKSKDWH